MIRRVMNNLKKILVTFSSRTTQKTKTAVTNSFAQDHATIMSIMTRNLTQN